MTNRERAKELLGYRIDIAGSQAAKDQPLIEAIERALDECKAEHQQRGYIAGLAMGQREMRERAANYIGHEISDSGTVFAKAIRAIPISGEEGEK